MPGDGCRWSVVTGARSGITASWSSEAVEPDEGSAAGAAFFVAGFGCDFCTGTCTSSGLGSETAGLVCLAAGRRAGALAARLRLLEEGLASPVPRPGLPRVPIGMISASPTAAPSPGSEGAHECGFGGQDALGAEDTGRHRGGEVGERLGSAEAGLETEHGAHPGGVQSAAEGQEGHLLGRE